MLKDLKQIAKTVWTLFLMWGGWRSRCHSAKTSEVRIDPVTGVVSGYGFDQSYCTVCWERCDGKYYNQLERYERNKNGTTNT